MNITINDVTGKILEETYKNYNILIIRTETDNQRKEHGIIFLKETDIIEEPVPIVDLTPYGLATFDNKICLITTTILRDKSGFYDTFSDGHILRRCYKIIDEVLVSE